jgi:tetratricopeptide (TPR) repeat protein
MLSQRYDMTEKQINIFYQKMGLEFLDSGENEKAKDCFDQGINHYKVAETIEAETIEIYMKNVYLYYLVSGNRRMALETLNIIEKEFGKSFSE